MQLVRIAAITASGLRMTRVAPLLGRVLLDEDERPGALPVVVLGYEQWQRRFNGDPGVLGRTVRLADTPHTIVGVMPEGFAFPIFHRAWVPLRLGEFPPRLAQVHPSLSLAGSPRVFTLAGTRRTRGHRRTPGGGVSAEPRRVRPGVSNYAQAFLGIDTPAMQIGIRAVQFGAAFLLLIVAVNVAVLVYARTATRFGEITVRTALGATRGRVIMQLFVEALVLSMNCFAARWL